MNLRRQSYVRRRLVLAAVLALVGFVVPFSINAAGSPSSDDQPNFGVNVYIFTPDIPLSQIQATVDKIANQQVSNQFGTQRYALLFEPGTYGSSANPLNFRVGYYTTVAGLGVSPRDVVINGSADVYNQCDSNGCNGPIEEFEMIDCVW